MGSGDVLSVTIGGQPCTVLASSFRRITCAAPPSANAAALAVTGAAGWTDAVPAANAAGFYMGGRGAAVQLYSGAASSLAAIASISSAPASAFVAADLLEVSKALCFRSVTFGWAVTADHLCGVRTQNQCCACG